MQGANNKPAARAKSKIILPAAPGRTRIEQANLGQQDTSPREISDNSAAEFAALPVDNSIQELPASEEPQDH
jgi:hypothetical protein